MSPTQEGDKQISLFHLLTLEMFPLPWRVRGKTTERRKILNCAFLNLVILSWLLLFLSPSFLFAQVELQYQNRADENVEYYEGIKPKPVSGYDIELISVLADYQESFDEFPSELKVQFYLARKADVNVTVRELDYKHYYWLDKVKPKTHWAPGFRNVFEWSTDTVLTRLGKSLVVYDLGVVARLDKKTPSANENISPAILYHSQLPEAIHGYRFTLKTGGDARLFCKFYKDGEDKPIDTQVFRRKRGGRPFTIHWDASQAAPGLYKLVISGFFLNTNEQIKKQTIQFYHQPSPQAG